MLVSGHVLLGGVQLVMPFSSFMRMRHFPALPAVPWCFRVLQVAAAFFKAEPAKGESLADEYKRYKDAENKLLHFQVEMKLPKGYVAPRAEGLASSSTPKKYGFSSYKTPAGYTGKDNKWDGKTG